MSGTIPLLLIHAFTARTGKTTFNHLQCEEAGRFSWKENFISTILHTTYKSSAH